MFGRYLNYLKDLLSVPQLLREIRDGIANQTEMINRRMTVAVPPSESPSLETEICIALLAAIPCPAVPFGADDPVPALLSDPAFADTLAWFAASPSAARALVSPHSQALLYALVRNLAPAHAIEIGTFRASTSEAIARALDAAGGGTLHTVDPFGAASVPPILKAWPRELQRRTQFYPVNSMEFFLLFDAKAGLVFIDGDHDHAYAEFDLTAAANAVTPGGFIIVDNIAQPGPYYAVCDFLDTHPGWRECGRPLPRTGTPPYDRERTGIKNTDFCILRAPEHVLVTARPYSTGQVVVTTPPTRIVLEPVHATSDGMLRVQLILRSFGESLSEFVATVSAPAKQTDGEIGIVFAEFPKLPSAARTTAELILQFDGGELALAPIALTA